jgi:hypothetical protein
MAQLCMMYSARSVACEKPESSAARIRSAFTCSVRTTPVLSRVARSARSSARGTSP